MQPINVIRPAQEKPFDGRCLLGHISYISFAQEWKVKWGDAPKKKSFLTLCAIFIALGIPTGRRLLDLSLGVTLLQETMWRSCKTQVHSAVWWAVLWHEVR